MTLRTECKCGHAQDTHHEKKYTCLACFCDCQKYRLFSDPEPPPRQSFKAAPKVDDLDWLDFDDDPAPDTDPTPTWPMFPIFPKVP